MTPLPPSVLRKAKVGERVRHGGPAYSRVVNVPLPGWLVAAVRSAAAHHRVTAPSAVRCLGMAWLHHADPTAVLDRLPPLPVRGPHVPRIQVRLDPAAANAFHAGCLRHGVWKAPVLGRLALAWVSSPGDGKEVAPEDIPDWLTGAG